MKKIMSILLVIAMLCSFAVTAAANDGLTPKYKVQREYNNQFTDVPLDAWYLGNVAAAYRLGLINGKSDTIFDPSGVVTIAETVKLAAVCHRLLLAKEVSDDYFTANYPNTSNWYEPYLRYCLNNNIVTETYPSYTAPASRAQVAVLFTRVLLYSGYTQAVLNKTDDVTLADIAEGSRYESAFYRLYSWGIMTGNEEGKMNPDSDVKRSEISAVIMRVIDEDYRITVEPAGQKPEEKPAEGDSTVVLYEGDFNTEGSFSGVSAVAAEFSGRNGSLTPLASSNLETLNDLVLSSRSISFKLYRGYGYDTLTIVRGWLKEAAAYVNGQKQDEPEALRSQLNEILKLWIEGDRCRIRELWIEEKDGWSEYTFYLADEVNPVLLTEVLFSLGRVSEDYAKSNSLDVLAAKIASDTTEPEIPVTDTEKYKAEIEAAKDSATMIIFEQECDRCTILYGIGLYGGFNSDYRLLLIFRNGEVLTVEKQRLEKVHMNEAGDVLYYSLVAPDGAEIMYGINLKVSQK